VKRMYRVPRRSFFTERAREYQRALALCRDRIIIDPGNSVHCGGCDAEVLEPIIHIVKDMDAGPTSTVSDIILCPNCRKESHGG